MAIRVGTGVGLTGAQWARRTLARDQAFFGYALLMPAVVLIVILVGVPFLRALWLSFHKKLLGAEDAPWIGLGNYAALLSDATFWQAVKNTFIFTSGSIVCKLILGLSIALILNEALPLRGVVALHRHAAVCHADAGIGAGVEVDVQRCRRSTELSGYRANLVDHQSCGWATRTSPCPRSSQSTCGAAFRSS